MFLASLGPIPFGGVGNRYPRELKSSDGNCRDGKLSINLPSGGLKCLSAIVNIKIDLLAKCKSIRKR